MFIDSVKITVRSGKGGDGCQSFYRDKYTRRGIADGGDGGRGADIIIIADRHSHSLIDFKYNRHFFGANGAHGSGKNKKGRDASSVVIRVPCGSTVKDLDTDCVLRDLNEDQEQVVVAKGGEGGKGNKHRREATKGEPGEERHLLLDLKLIADVGVVGFPNAGKSTLISQISNAQSKIAAYPFTTKFPVLGVVNYKEEPAFVVADIPGLIAGSSQGRGLGDRFLRHIEKTKVIVHLIDMSAEGGRLPLEDYKIIDKELEFYSKEIFAKPRIIAANKMDLEGAAENLKKFKQAVKKKVYAISALKKQGLEGLIEAIVKRL
ncbi:MAG: GTPase ObgE [Candidatus Omnitrophota bacterium]|nr:MAG: GTPase ObgE [Candidatus Omnitrophota bacterium]